MKFQLYYPVKPYLLNQSFGNPDPKYSNMGLLGHNGVDLSAYHGQPIYAAHDGLARYEIDSGGGHGVTIITHTPFDYKDTQALYKSIYWHMCDSKKESQFRSPVEDSAPQGMDVKAGDLIGYADNTGLSTGDHLHLGLKVLNPTSLLNIEQKNGYLGAIDPTPYFSGLFASDIHGTLLTRNLYLGTRGEDVVTLQQFLKRSNYFFAEPTGYFGPMTVVGVIRLQRYFGINPPLGFCGEKTRAFINNYI